MQNAVVAKLFDYLHKSLEKETEVADMEVHYFFMHHRRLYIQTMS